MTLTTHGVIGAALAKIAYANPFTAFVMGFLSHFVLDAIPHWDQPLLSKVVSEDGRDIKNMSIGFYFVIDLFNIFIDMCLGLFLVFVVMYLVAKPPVDITSLLFGFIGGVLPDALQFVYFKFRREPFILLQRFHKWIHADFSLRDKPALGIFLQTIIISIAIFLTAVF